MNEMLSRRRILDTMLATATLPFLPGTVRAIAGTAAIAPQRLVAMTRTIEVNGRPARVFGLDGPDGKPGLRLAPGERFRVDLANQAGVRTIIHWHGQLPPWTEDGFPWPQTPPIAAGAVRAYDYAPIPGTFWMHSHQGMQEQSLMAAPLIVRDGVALREDRQEIVLMLHDFSFTAPDELLARLTGMSTAAVRQMTRQVENVPAPTHDAPAGGRAGMSLSMRGMSMRGMAMAGTTSAMKMGSRIKMDLNDIDYDAFLANDRTLADPEIVRVDRAGRIRLRIINGASSSQFWIDLGALTGQVVAVDGHGVRPVADRRFPIAIAQRLDILIDLPNSGAFPVIAQLEGSRRRTGILLATAGAQITKVAVDGVRNAPPVDNSLEARLESHHPLTPRHADLTYRIVLSGGMKPYAWSLNGEFWPKVTPLMLAPGQRVEIELVNHSMMAHPMHLHGHAFQVVALNGRPVRGAVRDTVLVEPMGNVRIAFTADNPGRWAFHCHNLYHMMTGMMTEFRYRGIAL